MYKWAPELLDLLLHLSNSPLTNSRVEDLVELQEPEHVKPLTWADIEKDDPIDKRDDIWKSIRFADYSSDEEETILSEATTPASTLGDDGTIDPATSVLWRRVSYDTDLEKSLQANQFWNRAGDEPIEVSELQAIREAIFMLHGLPSSIFWRVSNTIEIDKRYKVSDLTTPTFQAILSSCGEVGSQVDRLRSFVTLGQKEVVLQTFQQAIETALLEFDKFLSSLETSFVNGDEGCVVSIMDFLELVRVQADPLFALVEVTEEMEASGQPDTVSCMEALFHATTRYEATGEAQPLGLLNDIFSTTFATYVRPILEWMRSGTLTEEKGFFITRTDSQDKTRIWADWFLLKDDRNDQRVPTFMIPHSNSVLIAGKSMAMLKLIEAPLSDESSGSMESPPHVPIATKGLMSFEHRFDEMVQGLIDPYYRSATTSLHHLLDESCGLRNVLLALQLLYFGNHGPSVDMFAFKMFERIDKCRSDWNDPFVLSQLFKTNLQHMECIDIDMIKVRAVAGYSRDMIHRRRSVNILKGFALDYKLPWSLANIISKVSLIGYQRVATMLFQIRRAICVLERRCLQNLALMNHLSYRRFHFIHHRLLNFTKVLYDHITSLAIESAASELMQSLDRALDIESMIKAHNTFVMRLQHRLLLTKALKPIREAILSNLDLCIRFSDVTNTCTRTPADDEVNADTRSFVSTRSHARRKKLVNTDSSDEDGEESDQEGYSVFVTDSDQRSQLEHVSDIENQFSQNVSFIAAGLRGLARADEDSVFWDILAERLESSSR